jgi:hypothetical protein
VCRLLVKTSCFISTMNTRHEIESRRPLLQISLQQKGICWM